MGIIEQGFQRNPIKNYNTYIANSFSELPLDAPVGSQGIFSSDDGFGIAVKFDYFWSNSSGNKLYTNVDLDISTQNCSVELTVGGAPVQSLKYNDAATITATADTGYTLTSLKVNGEDFTSGSTLTVNGDIVIEAAAEPASSGTVIADFHGITFTNDEGYAMYTADSGIEFDENNAYKKCTITLDGVEYEASSSASNGETIAIQSGFIGDPDLAVAIQAGVSSESVIIYSNYEELLSGEHDIKIVITETDSFYGIHANDREVLSVKIGLVERNPYVIAEGNSNVIITVDDTEIYNDTCVAITTIGEPNDYISVGTNDHDHPPYAEGLYQAIEDGKSISVSITDSQGKNVSFEEIDFKTSGEGYYHSGNELL